MIATIGTRSPPKLRMDSMYPPGEKLLDSQLSRVAQHQADETYFQYAPVKISNKAIIPKTNLTTRNRIGNSAKPKTLSPKASTRKIAIPASTRSDFNLSRPPADLRRNLVELTGIEPVASWLQTRRSPS